MSEKKTPRQPVETVVDDAMVLSFALMLNRIHQQSDASIAGFQDVRKEDTTNGRKDSE